MTHTRSPLSTYELYRRLGNILDDAILDAHNLVNSLETLRDTFRELVVATSEECDGCRSGIGPIDRRTEAQTGGWSDFDEMDKERGGRGGMNDGC